MDPAFVDLSVDQDVKHDNYAYSNYIKTKRRFVKCESTKCYIEVFLEIVINTWTLVSDWKTSTVPLS